MTAAHTGVSAWGRTLESLRRYVRRRPNGRAPGFVRDVRQVRLRSGVDASRTTPVQGVMVDVLARDGPTPACRLVERVARELYNSEVSRGAWAIEIGVFGSALFAADAAHELAAGAGALWDFEPESAAPR